jgi:excisionase family DNA binding protein
MGCSFNTPQPGRHADATLASLRYCVYVAQVPNPELLTAAQAATESGIPKRTIQYALRNGELKAAKLHGLTGTYVITRNDFDDWLAQRDGAA